MKPLLLLLALVAPLTPPVVPSAHAAAETPAARVSTVAEDTAVLSGLKPDSRIAGFRAAAVYLNDSDKPMGARFVHEKTGFTLDVLRIQTAPQMFLWVNTPPTSDKGEPHTQEHLLLGKGNKGRYVSSLEDLSLAGSSAYTQQWRTCYFGFTEAGGDTFFQLLEKQIDALLHPDYTDEEVRREVRNWGVTANKDGTLRLDEKGTVYNEMVSSSDRPGDRAWRAILTALYGDHHPLSYESGGTPEALRTLTPEDIRVFRDRNYRLSNIGMITAWPREMPLRATLVRADAMLNRLQGSDPVPRRVPGGADHTVPDFPAPQPALPGSVFSVPYPDSNTAQPGEVFFAWPANRSLSVTEETLLGLFLDALAGEPDTNLYKRLIDSKTRTRETGAQGVFGWVSSDLGKPVYVGLTGVPATRRTNADLLALRQEVMAEMERVAAYPDGSPELADFNQRIRDRITATKRTLSKFVNSPPGFGFRNSSSAWQEQLLQLEREGGFRRSVTYKPQMREVEAQISNKRNVWRTKLAEWKLLGVAPYAVTAVPDATLAARQEAEKRARAEAEAVRLATVYQTPDTQEAIRRYKADYDKTTREMEAMASGAPPLKFLENPPLVPDAQLDYKVTTIGAAKIPVVTSTFEDMTGATAGLSLRVDAVPEASQFLLSALPNLLSQAGVIENNIPLTYEQVLERQRREILSVGASFSTNATTRRVELQVSGSGNDANEARNAVAWMRRYLLFPDWRPENLPRLRDLVNQQLAGLRNRMKGPEEGWVSTVSAAYYRQDDPLLLHTTSFLTRAHDAHRLRWRLLEAGTTTERAQIVAFLTEQSKADVPSTRDTFKEAAAALRDGKTTGLVGLPPAVRAGAAEAGKDLLLLLPDLPENSLAADWSYLCRQMAQDLTVGPEKTLAELNAVRQSLLKTGGARFYIVGSRAAQKEIEKPLAELTERLTVAPVPAHIPSAPAIDARLRSRIPDAPVHPAYVGLLAPNMSGGVFLNSAEGISYRDTDPESVLRYLAFQLYGGGIAEGVFMQTWSAGLAYSNGIGSSPASGRVSYYAERTPELPETLKFTINLLKNAQKNPRLPEYAIASAFGGGRAASAYESRGMAMANDLADGYTPDVYRGFRQAVLNVRSRPDLTDALYARLPDAVSRVLPGWGPKAADVPGAVRFVIGPEKQMAAYEAYLKEAEGPDTRLFRLIPRDFWLTLPSDR